MIIECGNCVFDWHSVTKSRCASQGTRALALILRNNGSPGGAARQVHYGQSFGCQLIPDTISSSKIFSLSGFRSPLNGIFHIPLSELSSARSGPARSG